MNEDLKEKLKRQGGTGLDLSPGDPTAQEALKTIENLETDNIWLRDEIKEMAAQFHKREVEFEQQFEATIQKQCESDKEIAKLQEANKALLEIIETLKDKAAGGNKSWL
jgi:hypothetical protein